MWNIPVLDRASVVRPKWHRAATASLVVLAAGAPVPALALVLGITEGLTYRATDNQIEARFEPLAEVLSKAVRQPVTIKVISSYDQMRAALQQQQLDLAFIHPAHVALAAVKSGRYQAAAWTAGFTDYKVSLLCKGQTPKITDWSSVADKNLVTPDPDSITAVITRAMLREHGVQTQAAMLKTTRFQDAVPFYVEHGFAVYGATASKAVVRSWKEAGGQTCAESRPVPIKQWLVSTQLDATITGVLRDTLLSLSQTDAGRRALSVSTYSGFISTVPDTEKMLSGWLGL